jgi:poly-gamma-glutamate synthesis protein (capsule biosynthesis protein)
MAVTIALAGDTMLGRGVAERLERDGPYTVFAPQIRELAMSADLFVLNLECCVSHRGEPWPDPRKPFFFRAPPVAVETLKWLGVDVATLANNHALDFGAVALHDTLSHLRGAGIRVVGAGATVAEARKPVIVEASGVRIAIVGVADHPADFAAGPERAGIAFADLHHGVPSWLTDLVRRLRDEADVVVVTPHWGPNMVPTPRPHVRAAAGKLVDAGATLIAGHSAHVFHGMLGRVLYDLGDFVDDYRVDPLLRNDLGILAFVTLDSQGPRQIRVVPIALDFCFTRLATDKEYDWVAHRLHAACRALGERVQLRDEGDHLSLTWHEH